MTASKTAVVVLLGYVFISNIRNWKSLAVYIGLIVIVGVGGGFDIVVQRFYKYDLTTGRIDALIQYFQSKLYPIQIFRGYGSGFVYHSELFAYKAGFEFPIIMYALDYGLIFAILMVGGTYMFLSYQLIKNRLYIGWVGYSLLFVEINTYNGISLTNQDVFCFFSLLNLLILNSIALKQNCYSRILEHKNWLK